VLPPAPAAPPVPVAPLLPAAPSVPSAPPLPEAPPSPLLPPWPLPPEPTTVLPPDPEAPPVPFVAPPLPPPPVAGAPPDPPSPLESLPHPTARARNATVQSTQRPCVKGFLMLIWLSLSARSFVTASTPVSSLRVFVERPTSVLEDAFRLPLGSNIRNRWRTASGRPGVGWSSSEVIVG
jgi:hypothetical protein